MSVINGHRVSVVAKYLGPTDYRGSRIKVVRGDHRQGDPTLTVSWDHALDMDENYVAAIRAFLVKLDWLDDHRGGECEWVVGSTGNGYVGVQVPREGER